MPGSEAEKNEGAGSQLERALAAQSERVRELAPLIEGVLDGSLAPEQAARRAALAPDSLEAFRAVAGRQVRVDGKLITFGEGNQFGDIRIQDVAGRDVVKIAVVLSPREEYNVAGYANPYIGLRAFTDTADDVAAYGGRERSVATIVAKLVATDAPQSLLIVGGASGSGKSSFAQAGLIPALRAYYQARGREVEVALIRPGDRPRAALRDALAQLKLGLERDPGDQLAAALVDALRASASVVKLLVLDQFEELFTLPEQEQAQERAQKERERETLWQFLSGLPSFTEASAHVIVTVRSEFVGRIYETVPLEQGSHLLLTLRAMGKDDLKLAIEKPVRQKYGERKQIEPALLERLVADTLADASYLPLLQVTLEDLWNRGALVLGNYAGISEAIRKRADEVIDYKDYDGLQEIPRGPADRDVMMEIFTDLVAVSPDDDPLRDIRRRRRLADVAVNEQRRRLIDDLLAARLLSKNVELDRGDEIEYVDIIHESLIARWDRLAADITRRRERLLQRRRFEDALAEWLQRGRPRGYLLSGPRLSEAEQLRQSDDIAVRSQDARALVQQSVAQRSRARQLQIVLGNVIFVIVLGLIALGVVNRQTSEALRAAEAARSRAEAAEEKLSAANAATEVERDRAATQRLALQALSLRTQDPELALLLAYEAAARNPDSITQQALRSTLYRTESIRLLRGHAGSVEGVGMSPDGQLVVTAGADRLGRVFTIEGTPVVTLTGHTDLVRSATFSPGGDHILTASADGSARVWDLEGQELYKVEGQGRSLWDGAFSPDGQLVLAGDRDGYAYLWNLEGELLTTFATERTDGADNTIRRVAFSPDGSQILLAGFNNKAELWAIDGTRVAILATSGPLNAARFQPEGAGSLILTASSNREIQLWRRDNLEQPVGAFSTDRSIWDAQFTPDGSLIIIALSDGRIQIRDLEGTLLRNFRAHSRAIPTLALGNREDGPYLLSSAADGTARSWRLDELLDDDQGEERPSAIYNGHTGTVWGVAFKPDGSAFATVGDDGWVRLWNTEGTLINAFEAHTNRVWDISIDRRGRLLTASTDNTARLWANDRGDGFQTLSGHSDDVRRASFHPLRDDQILTASADDTAILWDIGNTAAITGTPLMVFRGHTDNVNSAVMSPDGQMVLTASNDNTARLWSLDGTEIGRFEHSGNVNTAVFDRRGQRILTASSDGTVRLWGLDGTRFLTLGVLSASESRYSAPIASASFSPDEAFILTASDDRTARVWDANSGELLTILGEHDDVLYAAAFNPKDIRFIVTTSRDGLGRLWRTDAEPLPSLVTLGHPSWLTSAVYDRERTRVLTASGDKLARLWTIDGTAIVTLTGHTDTVLSAVFSPDEQHMLTASEDGTARLWNMKGEEERSFGARGASVLSAVFSPDGQHIATTSADAMVRIWDIGGTELMTLTGHLDDVYSAQFSADGLRLLTASEDGTARLWSLETAETLEIFRGHTAGVYTAVFSPESQREAVLTSSWDDTARLWDLEGRELLVLQHPANVRWAEFSPTDPLILTAGSDATVRLWSWEGEQVAVLPGHKSSVQMARFSSDGQRIITASYDYTARQHVVHIEDLLHAAACQAERPLTEEEVMRYEIPGDPRMPVEPTDC